MKQKTAIEYWDHLFTIPMTNKDMIIENNNHMDFLKQSLQLGFFVPCDNEGKPLEHPNFIKGNRTADYYSMKMEEYQQACDRVLFKGFEVDDNHERYVVISITTKEDYIEVYFNRSDGNTPDFMDTKTINDLSGKVDLVEKVAEQFKY